MKLKNFSITELQFLSSPIIYERGLKYYEEGLLVSACVLENTIAGKVIGSSGFYYVSLQFNDSGLHWECSCPCSDFCKHLVAVAYAWLTNPKFFKNLRSNLVKVIESPDLSDYFIKLVAKNPINFLELVEAGLSEQIKLPKRSKRDVINLVRNIFKDHQFNANDIEENWAKINQVGEILKPKIEVGDKEALIALQELVKSLFITYNNFPNQLLEEIILSNINLINEVIANYSNSELKDFMEEIFSLYLNPTFWSFSEFIRKYLAVYFNQHPHELSVLLQRINHKEQELIIQIALYELLELLDDDYKLCEIYIQLKEEIVKQEAGQLWLIDRSIGNLNYDAAFQLAKTGIKNQIGLSKQAFRERLIEIHRHRGEYKQAAALSFRHFEELLSFEEYLRLKKLLQKHPDDYLYYCRKIESILLNENNPQLHLRIKIDQLDYQWVQNNIEAIRNDQSLIRELANHLLTNLNSNSMRLYTSLIDLLLEDSCKANQNIVISLLTKLKRYCLQNSNLEYWKSYSNALITKYRIQLQMSQKYSNILQNN